MWLVRVKPDLRPYESRFEREGRVKAGEDDSMFITVPKIVTDARAISNLHHVENVGEVEIRSDFYFTQCVAYENEQTGDVP